MNRAAVSRKQLYRFDLKKTTILLVIFLVLVSIPFYISNILIAGEKKLVADQLTAISRLKTDTLNHWFEKLEKDSLLIANDSLLSATVERWLSEGRESNSDRKLILQRLELLKTTFDFNNVILFDPEQSPVLAINAEASICQHRDHVESLNPRSIIIGDLHTHANLNNADIDSVEFHVLMPLFNSGNDQSELLGTIMIIIDPNKQLFPTIKAWPLTSKTGESLLAMRLGNEITFPHNLRFSSGKEFMLKIPLNQGDLIFGSAFLTHDEIIEAYDYRGEKVIAVSSMTIRPNWVVLTKIDVDEIYASLGSKLVQIALPVILLFVLLIGANYSWRKNLSLTHQKHKDKAKTRLQALNKHYSYLTKYANDIILLSDDEGVILEVNDRALESYQYSKEELIGKNIMDLEYKRTDGEAREKLFSISNDGMMFETSHRKKDGSVLPVEINYRSILINKIVFRQLIIRDITERRKSLSNLKRVERRFQLAVEATRTGIWDWEMFDDKVWWSPEQYALLGYENNEIEINIDSALELTHPQDKSKFKSALIAHLQKGDIFNINLRLRTKSGKYRWFKTTGSVTKNRQGVNKRMLGSLVDITERILSQQRLINANRALRTLSAANEAVIYSRTEDELLKNISNVMVDEGGYLLSRIYYLDTANTTPFRMMMKASDKDMNMDNFDDRAFIKFLEKHDYSNEAINTSKHVVCQDIINDPKFTDLRTQAFMDGYVAMMILPLVEANKVFGLLVIFSSSTFAFNQDETVLLDELSNDLSFGISSLRIKERHKRIEDELK